MTQATHNTRTRAATESGAETLVVEPFGGMAGDMFLAALLDLGDPRFELAHLRELAEALVPGEAQLSQSTVWRGSLSGCHLDVVTPETTAPPHRGLADLASLVEASPLSSAAKAFTMSVLRRIAVAEGNVHGCSPEEVHFHEVGAVDTLIDVGGAALGLDRLGILQGFATPPVLGSGTVECAHGTMPVPAPATAEILRGYEQELGGGGGERCTPTGAALLVELVHMGGGSGRFGQPSEITGGTFSPASIGYGAGTRDPKVGPPNLLRVQLGSLKAAAGIDPQSSTVVDEVSVNLDDMPAEEIGELVRGLRAAGALEVWTSPVMMKKDRPAAVVTCLVRPEDRARILAHVFERSSTFGARWHTVQRLEAGRRFATVDIDGIPVRIKIRQRPSYAGRSDDSEMDLFCEHDDVVKLAEQLNVPLRVARTRALEEARTQLGA